MADAGGLSADHIPAFCSDPNCWWCPDARRALESGRD
jgi:hypothetical protein